MPRPYGGREYTLPSPSISSPPNLILHACLLGPASISSLTRARLCSLLRLHFLPPAGEGDAAPAARCCYCNLPDVEVWCALLNKLSNGLLGRHNGSALLRMISKAKGSTNTLVGIMLNTFPGFCNYINLDAPGVAPSCRWKAARGVALNLVVHFHKWVQIMVANLWAALGRQRHDGGGGIGGGGPLSESSRGLPRGVDLQV
jgi:hypothetical protein